MISFQGQTQKLLAMEFCSKDRAAGEMASPDLSFPVSQYGMSMHKRPIIFLGYISRARDKLYRFFESESCHTVKNPDRNSLAPPGLERQ